MIHIHNMPIAAASPLRSATTLLAVSNRARLSRRAQEILM